MIVSRLRTVNPPHPDLFTNNNQLVISESFKILGVLFDSKFTFEQHVCFLLYCIESWSAQEILLDFWCPDGFIKVFIFFLFYPV